MLLYNYKKEFVGMDEQDLKTLGFTDLAALLAQTDDFADFFVREPGFVHNFKHVHWIDFVECADDSESQKALICVNSKTFRCNLNIKTFYLSDKPSSKAYMVTLQNLRELGNQEDISLSSPFIKSAPIAQTKTPNIVNSPKNPDEMQEIPTPKSAELLVEETPDIEIPKVPEVVKVFEEKIPEIVIEAAPIEVLPEKPEIAVKRDLDAPKIRDEFIYHEEVKEEKREVAKEIEEEFEEEYSYDPKIASSELGLPVDLIEEFIEDFIVQTKEFKSELYNALENGDIAQIKTLSHKLKGVASNLRIEDALDVLTTINTSDNLTEIKLNLELFYKIIAKLSGEEVYLHKKSVAPKKEEPIKLEQMQEIKVQESGDDDFILDFKQDTPAEVKPSLEIKAEDDDLIISFKEDVIEAPKVEESPEIEPTLEATAEEITYNKKQAAAEIGLDDETFCELFEDYLLESGTLCNSIHSAIESNNPGMCKLNAIKLKGMSDNMRISDLTAELETIIGTEDMEVAKKAIDKIDTIIAKISKVES